MPLSLQYGIDKTEDNPGLRLVFVNLAPLIMAEYSRKKGEPTPKSAITTLMSHFRLLRNTIDSHAEVIDARCVLFVISRVQ